MTRSALALCPASERARRCPLCGGALAVECVAATERRRVRAALTYAASKCCCCAATRHRSPPPPWLGESGVRTFARARARRRVDETPSSALIPRAHIPRASRTHARSLARSFAAFSSPAASVVLFDAQTRRCGKLFASRVSERDWAVARRVRSSWRKPYVRFLHHELSRYKSTLLFRHVIVVAKQVRLAVTWPQLTARVCVFQSCRRIFNCSYASLYLASA